MRPIGWGLAVALFAAVLAPVAVISAPKAPPAVSDAQRKQGMAEAPALAQAAGLPCQVSDARFIGKQEDKKAKTSVSYYELACGQSMGYIMQAPAGGTPTAFTCIEADTPAEAGKPAALPCILPANSDPKAQLAPVLTKAGVQCVPESARGIGQSKTSTFMEVACQGGSGYVVIASAPFDAAKPAEAQNCLNFDDGAGNIKCTLTDKAKRLAVVDSFAKAATASCVVKDRRFVGASKDGSNFYEAACQDGKGYIYKVDGKGAVAQSWDCAKAQAILGGCELTNAREAETQQAALYTRLAKTAGSSCDVDKYAIFPSQGAEDIVELVCKDGSGGVGVFPSTGKGQVLDCGHALVAGYKCGLNKPESGYAALTADLRKFDQKTCTVSNSRLAAKTAKGTILVEVACSDGFKGYMIEYNATPTVSAVGATGCAFAGGCKLPGNT
ncbi:hypothetical protein DJ021_09740 [Phenylobacterium hankyongense]|uniref:Uncharacterized protein n=1 Tax=Phenylobacterium hankyongense TaxID=1813876 RepID=A0A328AZM9_9CAUL|nr:hypothetical protein [Phenylobacterium hankyongense]RAK60067.1 hypothetical protein DJ021_09740 [Phenylobacterium hankyongense]